MSSTGDNTPLLLTAAGKGRFRGETEGVCAENAEKGRVGIAAQTWQYIQELTRDTTLPDLREAVERLLLLSNADPQVSLRFTNDETLPKQRSSPSAATEPQCEMRPLLAFLPGTLTKPPVSFLSKACSAMRLFNSVEL